MAARHPFSRAIAITSVLSSSAIPLSSLLTWLQARVSIFFLYHAHSEQTPTHLNTALKAAFAETSHNDFPSLEAPNVNRDISLS